MSVRPQHDEEQVWDWRYEVQNGPDGRDGAIGRFAEGPVPGSSVVLCLKTRSPLRRRVHEGEMVDTFMQHILWRTINTLVPKPGVNARRGSERFVFQDSKADHIC